MTSELIDVWARLVDLLIDRAGTSPRLRAGASEDHIASAEAEVRVRFPDDIRASLRIHDGEEPGGLVWLPAGGRLLSTDEIVAAWRQSRADAPRRIAVVAARSGDGVHCELASGRRGPRGQLVLRIADEDRAIAGAGWRDLLRRYAYLLSTDRLAYQPGDASPGAPTSAPGSIVPAGGGELGALLADAPVQLDQRNLLP